MGLHIDELKDIQNDKDITSLVYKFLKDGGQNGFAKGTLRRGSESKLNWLGPVLFPLDQLTRCTGPEADKEYSKPKKFGKKRSAHS